jgi:flagellar hook assembly protein FlgD
MLPVQNYPNPFNPTTNIEFTLPTAQQVQLTVYNLKGQKIRTLVDEIYPAGKNTVVWNGKDKAGREVSSGVYFYKLETAHANITKKMLLMK